MGSREGCMKFITYHFKILKIILSLALVCLPIYDVIPTRVNNVIPAHADGPYGSNNPPVWALISDQTINEGETLTFTVSATDPDGDPLTYHAGGFILPENCPS